MTAERRVPPNPAAPRVSKAARDLLAEADALSAEGYDAIEEAGEAVAELVRELEENGELTPGPK